MRDCCRTDISHYIQSGRWFGRYDVMLEPRNPEKDDAIILEFKVSNARKESCLEDTVLIG